MIIYSLVLFPFFVSIPKTISCNIIIFLPYLIIQSSLYLSFSCFYSCLFYYSNLLFISPYSLSLITPKKLIGVEFSFFWEETTNEFLFTEFVCLDPRLDWLLLSSKLTSSTAFNFFLRDNLWLGRYHLWCIYPWENTWLLIMCWATLDLSLLPKLFKFLDRIWFIMFAAFLYSSSFFFLTCIFYSSFALSSISCNTSKTFLPLARLSLTTLWFSLCLHIFFPL